MPSPADRIRLEWSLRAVALLVMAWLIVASFAERKLPGGAVVVPARLEHALAEWSSRPEAETLAITFTAPPSPMARAWLRALRRAGTSIAWQQEGIAPLALEVEPVQDPAGGTVVRVSGTRGEPVILSDSLGALDSVSADGLGASVRVPFHTGLISARAGTTTAVSRAGEAGHTRGVLVLGMAGWESRFVVEALAERGWRVEARLGVAPGITVVRGNPSPIDTARFATVIALDSSAAAFSPQLVGFVQSGGGLILGPGISPRSLRSSPSQVTAISQPQGRGDVMAWRVGEGRVVQLSNDETWKWRMQPGEASVADHRRWWGALVSTVACRPPGMKDQGDAPLASLVTGLGEPRELPAGSATRTWWGLALAILVLSLFTEWTSRRLRGAA